MVLLFSLENSITLDQGFPTGSMLLRCKCYTNKCWHNGVCMYMYTVYGESSLDMSNMFVFQGLWVHSAFPLPLPNFKVSHHCFRSITHPLPFVDWKPFQWVLINISLTIILNLSDRKICYGIFPKNDIGLHYIKRVFYWLD